MAAQLARAVDRGARVLGEHRVTQILSGRGRVTGVLAEVWGADVTVVSAELTLADVNPAMAELCDLAAAARAQAHELAQATGKAHALRSA